VFDYLGSTFLENTKNSASEAVPEVAAMEGSDETKQKKTFKLKPSKDRAGKKKKMCTIV